jgi:hypothetical protein
MARLAGIGVLGRDIGRLMLPAARRMVSKLT